MFRAPFQFWVSLHALKAALGTSSGQLIGDVCVARESEVPGQA